MLGRAWVTIGSAMRLALASGLHTRSHYSLIDPKQEQVILNTWWSLHNLESLISSMTGMLPMLHSEHVTTPSPSAVAIFSQHNTTPTSSMAYSDAQIYLASISQEVLSNLYTERRTARPWSQIHSMMTSMQVELDNWALEAMPHPLEDSQSPSDHGAQYMMLKGQYYRVRILITRPSLRRIEQCTERCSENFTPSDQEFAETCIQTAQDVASLLPDEVNPRIIYEKGSWWTAVHRSESSTCTTHAALEANVHKSCKPSPSSS